MQELCKAIDDKSDAKIAEKVCLFDCCFYVFLTPYIQFRLRALGIKKAEEAKSDDDGDDDDEDDEITTKPTTASRKSARCDNGLDDVLLLLFVCFTEK